MHYYFVLPLAVVAVFLADRVDAQGRDAEYIEEYYHRLRIGRGKNFSKGGEFYPPPGSYFYRIHGRPPPPERPPPSEPESVSESDESGPNEREEGAPPPNAWKARSAKSAPHRRNGTESASLEV